MSLLNASDFSDGDIPSPIRTPNKENTIPNNLDDSSRILSNDSNNISSSNSSPSITIKNCCEEFKQSTEQEVLYSSSPVPALALSKLIKNHQEERNISNNYSNNHQTPNSSRSTHSNNSSTTTSTTITGGNISQRTVSPIHNSRPLVDHHSSSHYSNPNNSTLHYSLNTTRSSTSTTSGSRFLSPQTPRRFPMFRTTSTPTVLSPRFPPLLSPRLTYSKAHHQQTSLNEIVQTTIDEEGIYPSFGFLLETLCERQFDRVSKSVHSIIDDSEHEIQQLKMWIEKNLEEIDYLTLTKEQLILQSQELWKENDSSRQQLLSKSKENENLKFELEMKSLECKNGERQLNGMKNQNLEIENRMDQLERELKLKERQVLSLNNNLFESEEKYKMKMNEISSLNSKIESYLSETNDLKLAKEKLEKQIETLKNEVKTLKSNNEGYLTIIDQQNKTINRVNSNLKEKQSELEDKDSERQQLNHQLTLIKRNCSEKESLLSDSQNDLTKLKRRFEDQSKEFELYRQEMKLEMQKYHALISDHQQSKMNELEKDQILKKHSSLLEQFESLQLKHNNSVSDLHETRRECQDYQRTIDSQKKELERLTKTVQETQDEKLKLEERIKWLEKNSLEQKSSISKLHKENEELEMKIYDFRKDFKMMDQRLNEKLGECSEQEKEIQQLLDKTKGKDLEIEKSQEKNASLQQRVLELDTQVKQLNGDIADLNEECEMLRKYISEEKSFILESDPTLKMVLMMKQEGFPIDESYIDKIRGRSIFNLLRMGVGAYNVRTSSGEEQNGGPLSIDSERRKEETFFAEKALSNWLSNLLPEYYDSKLNFYENIVDGFLLCRMIDTLFKEVQPCDHIRVDISLMRNQRSDSDNLAVYLEHCRKLELKSYFEPEMLFKVKDAFKGVPSLAQDSMSMSRERALIVSNIAQIFELGVKCNTSPRKKEEVLIKLSNAKLERDANSPIFARSRSSSVNSSRGGAIRPKRNSIALTNFSMAIPSPRSTTTISTTNTTTGASQDGGHLTPKSARFFKDSMFLDSPTIAGSKTPPTIPYLKPFSNSSNDCLSQVSSPLSNVTTEDDIWLEHMLEDMKISPSSPSESKFTLKYYLNRAGSGTTR